MVLNFRLRSYTLFESRNTHANIVAANFNETTDHADRFSFTSESLSLLQVKQVMASFLCYDNSDVIVTLIITNFHLYLIHVWCQFQFPNL